MTYSASVNGVITSPPAVPQLSHGAAGAPVTPGQVQGPACAHGEGSTYQANRCFL